jgi:choline dehydrogenase-like flavoprotein
MMRSSHLQLDIVIIGAGIADTATATYLTGFALASLKLRVLLNEVGAGIQISCEPLAATIYLGA